MTSRKTSRDRIVDAGLAEMLAKGFSATTVDDICERAAVSKGNFYHFFSSKEDVALAAINAFYERNLEITAEAPAAGNDRRQHAQALVNHLIDAAGRMWGGGCLLGSFALELAETNPTIGSAVSERFRAVAAQLADGFAPLVQDGTRGNAADIAEQFIVTVEGALVLARAHHDWSYVDRALERFRKSVGVERG